MPLFTSAREKRLWLYALSVLIAIFLTLFLGQPLVALFESQDLRAAIFLYVMFLIALAILFYGLKYKPGSIEITTIIGITAVYSMFFLRLGMPERSHLMEYSILAIFIHQALVERKSQGKYLPRPALLAIISTFLLGLLDECLQIFIPNRVFDPNDILFNGLAALMAIGSILILNWVRNSVGKKKKPSN